MKPNQAERRGASPAQAILDVALDLAEATGWDNLHLHDIARESGITLAEIHHHYSDKDALAEAWFDRADEALVTLPQTLGWESFSVRKRLHRALFAWFDALAAHRRLTASMLRYKFQPEHLHLQLLGVTRISRTVQWIREAAHLDSTGLRRELEEVALTGIFLASFGCWLGDDSPNSKRTHAVLDRLLKNAERVALNLPGRGPRRDRTGGDQPSDHDAPRAPRPDDENGMGHRVH